MSYLRAPIDVDLAQLVDDALARIARKIPSWVPREGHLEVAVIEELARLVQETYAVAATVPDDIFSAYGRELAGIPQVEGQPAVGTVQFAVSDAAGYNIPAGTVVAAAVSGDEQIFFATGATLTIPTGSTTGTVQAVAEQDGQDANGFTGPVEVIDQLAFVDSATLVGLTSGGVDAEDDVTYRDRLADELRLSAPRPILPADFAAFARQIVGVHRALVVDGYDPDSETFDNPRMVTVVPVDADGLTPSQPVVDALEADLQSRREVNFVVNADEPTYTPVAVVVEFVPADGFTDQAAEEAVEAAVVRLLSPAVFGGGDQSPPVWEQQDTVRFLDLAAAIAADDAVAGLTSLTVNGDAEDVQLSGVVPLPAPFDDPSTPSTVSATAVS